MIDYSLKKTLIQTFDVSLDVLRRFKQDRLTRHAAALTFNSLLAIAPMMALVLSMFSLFASFDEISKSFDSFIYQSLAPGVGDDIKQYVEQFASQAGKLSFVGLLFFLLTALFLLFNIEESFNDIFRVEKGRSVLSRLPIYWTLVTLGPMLMGVSLTISTYLLSLSVMAPEGFSGHIQSAGVVLLPFFLEILAFTLLYLVMLLFEISKKAFAVYLLNFGSYKVIYGALSALPIFLMWIYLCWIIALIGAQVVSVLKHRSICNRSDQSEVLDDVQEAD